MKQMRDKIFNNKAIYIYMFLLQIPEAILSTAFEKSPKMHGLAIAAS
jgi:hypothetical protein